MILIIDFGSQTTHLIGRRLRQLGVKNEYVDPENILKEVKKYKPSGIILSGGPSSVYDDGAPGINKKIFGTGDVCLLSFLIGGTILGIFFALLCYPIAKILFKKFTNKFQAKVGVE